MATVRIPPLLAGGLMPTWRCTNTCRHCLYNCSPRQPDVWMAPDTLRSTLAALEREPSLVELHIGGGEPCLDLERLVEMVRQTVAAGLPLAYVETNAFWCVTREASYDGMRRLRAAGLGALLVSVSMFHNEFVPMSSVRHAVEAAREVFGSGGLIVYLPHLYELLVRLPGEGKRSLEEFCRLTGLAGELGRLPSLYGVIAGGRAARALRSSYRPRPARELLRRGCAGRLLDTTHFHIDPSGDLFTGLCAGLSPASIEELHPAITPETHPIFTTLLEHGPLGLMERAAADHGFEERADGYVSPCDLCEDVRRHLHGLGGFRELRPASFYGEQAVEDEAERQGVTA